MTATIKKAEDRIKNQTKDQNNEAITQTNKPALQKDQNKAALK